MTITMNMQAAKTNLSRLINNVRNGDEVIIANRNVPVAKLVMFEEEEKLKERPLGLFPGPVPPDSFWDPMTDEELRDWGML